MPQSPLTLSPLPFAPGVNVPPRYCIAHNSSDKRRKMEPSAFRECTTCHMPVQTTYVGFTLCAPCSEKEKRCMICGACAPECSSYVPPTSIKRLVESGAALLSPMCL